MVIKYIPDSDDNSKWIYKPLDTNGDGTGSENASVNGSVTPVEFFIQPPPGDVYVLTRMIVKVQDGGNFRADYYGAISAGAPNGINMQVTDADDNVLLELPPSLRPQTNAEWGVLCYDVDLKAWGTGSEFLLVRFTFERSGRPLILKDRQKFKIIISDDLTGLEDHIFHVQGYIGYGRVGRL